MDFNQLANLLIIPALVGIAWINRSVSRLEANVTQLQKDNTEVFRHINKHVEDIANVNRAVARIEGHLEK